METPSRVPRARVAGRRKASDNASILPEAVTDRTDRLVEISDQCGAAKRAAENVGEGFLAFLLSMAIEEARTAMRRATLGMPAPRRKRASKSVS